MPFRLLQQQQQQQQQHRTSMSSSLSSSSSLLSVSSSVTRILTLAAAVVVVVIVCSSSLVLAVSSSSSSLEDHNISSVVANNSSSSSSSSSSSTSSTSTSSSSSDGSSIWDADLFHLPSHVPFPGTDWLNRIATPETSFSWPKKKEDDGDGSVTATTATTTTATTYSSAYAAILDNDPLRYPCRNFNAYLNSVFLSAETAAWFVTVTGSATAAHYCLCYVRNFIGAVVIYYGVAAVFHYFCYCSAAAVTTFEQQQRARPTAAVMWDQVKLAQCSMILYVLLPVADEILVEEGWTAAYYTVSEIGGWRMYCLYMTLYFAAVEIGIYWTHRTLHTNKWLYKNVHVIHHRYNRPETLTPWASIAFHPVDGILQASPYVAAMVFVPCHYPSHVALLFFTAVWATYIHDAMDWNVDPVMGSKYHTVHHTHYMYNYGQVFIFCDWFWGTLRVPEGPTGVSKKKKNINNISDDDKGDHDNDNTTSKKIQ